MKTTEFNFDGLIGPTHNYAGLAFGNLASMKNRAAISSPRAAAREGLAKMRQLAKLGAPQAILPPHERPHVPTLRALGYHGGDAALLARVGAENPQLLANVSSASAMWTANAATVSPGTDTRDGRTHFTPANLTSQFHRSLEPATTARVLRAIFSDEQHFAHHDPLPPAALFSDEGAANQMRFEPVGAAALEVFVYGRDGGRADERSDAGRARRADHDLPGKFPARQTLEASQALARLHGLDPARTLFLRQSAAAIDAGVFHNDVAAVAHRHVLLHHVEAFAEPLPDLAGMTICPAAFPLSAAIGSYIFNSQLVSAPDGSLLLIAPEEARRFPAVMDYLGSIIGPGKPISAAHFVQVRQSMRNGGGPACLRLRVPLTEPQAASIRPRVILDDALFSALEAWIDQHYREELRPDDLRDPQLLTESRAALEALTKLLGLGSIYDFQR